MVWSIPLSRVEEIKMDNSDYCIVVVRNLAKVNVRVRFSLVALMV